ncbi:MAG TPA: endonuclease III, partial [Ktedonobacterales bacterium]|nr:endonuclease III [Ktedonobacterales bacterium]
PVRVKAILQKLDEAYPAVTCALEHENAFQLLISTILSAQCTDERVNMVTKKLFKTYPMAADYANADPTTLEDDLKQITFYRNKARNIRAMANILVTRYNGEVPRTLAEVVALPGAARKTANVVLGNAYGIIEGIAVDTHVGRLMRRMGFTRSEDPVVIEQQLMKIVPRDVWVLFTHLMIYHGRAICQARKPLCDQCLVAARCPKII